MKITICGSMTFSPEMLKVADILKSKRNEIHLPAFIRDYSKLDSRDKMHVESAKNKINHDLIRYYWKLIQDSDAILVFNKTKKNIENYIGANTLIEMAFAHVLNKKIFLLNPIPEQDCKDEILVMKPIILNGDLSKIK